jgi:AraC-like DNA-binding protein
MKSHSKFFKKPEVIIPGGRVEIMFTTDVTINWTDSEYPDRSDSYTESYLLGPRNRPFYVEMSGVVDLIGVRFKPGGLAPFTDIPVHLLLNQVVLLDHVFGKKASVLTTQLFEQTDVHRQIIVIENFLLSKIGSDPGLHNIVRLISVIKNQPFTSIEALSMTTGMHYKKLERTFARFTGYSPKNFSRVVRFYQALKQMQVKHNTLTDVGLNNGYYDQAHFIRDFKAFTGKPPSQFHSESPVIANLLLQSVNV